MASMSLKNVSKYFGNVAAVKDLSLHIMDREFFTLLGPSGCGKSTTLNLVAGLEIPDEGEIYIGDRQVNDLSPRERNVAMVFQSYALYPHMNVFENIAFPLRVPGRKLNKEEIDKSVHRTAQALMIEDLLGRLPKELSGGQRQRVALGRAIVRRPAVFLMDEPLSNLDARLRLQMRAELKQLHQQLQTTIIFVTHDQAEAMTLSDRIAIIRDGVLEQVGTPMECYDQPNSVFVAGFVGERNINLLEGTLGSHDGQGFFLSGGSEWPIPETKREALSDLPTSSELVLGMRPENVLVSRTAGEHNVAGEVILLEPMGSHTFVHVGVGKQKVVAKVSPFFRVKPLDRVWLEVNRDTLHLYDKKTGRAIF